MSRKMRGVLAGAAADLEHLSRVRESTSEDFEYRALITLAGLGDGVAHRKSLSRFPVPGTLILL
jgi:hypothetical protein